MRGKYSPTVSKAYMHDQSWHDRLREVTGDPAVDDPVYDPDGYDSYGYDKNDVDRAGNEESEYYLDDKDEQGESLGYNSKYDQAYNEWTFDGVRPVRR